MVPSNSAAVIACRTAAESRFVDRHWPCDQCGEPIESAGARITIKNTREPSAGGRERFTREGFCAECAAPIKRVYEYPADAAAPADQLGGADPSQAIGAADFEALIALARTAPEGPATLPLDEYWRWRAALKGGLVAANELAKLGGDADAAVKRIESLRALYADAALLSARQRELEAARAAIYALDKDALAAHRQWLESDGANGVRLELEGAIIETMKVGASLELGRARLDRCAILLQVIDYSDWSAAELTACRGFYSRFGASRFAAASLADCRFTGAAFSLSNLDDCVVTGGEFRRAKFTRCDLLRAHFADVDLREARFGDSVLDGARFEGCDLRGASFAVGDELYAERNTAAGAVFVGCDLRGATFAGRRLSATRFQDCQLHGIAGPAALGSIDVSGADLSPAGDGSRLGTAAEVEGLLRGP